MPANTAPNRPTAAQGETRNFAVSFKDVLDSGELLTGTPTVAEQTSTDLTVSNKVVNTAALTIDSISVAIGQAVQFKVSGMLTATGTYTIKITVSTNASPAQTLVKYIHFNTASA